tara:strand:+ start:7332 stop:8495 length:1164 start_codon:yes stop_codon:yes gene_type:complete
MANNKIANTDKAGSGGANKNTVVYFGKVVSIEDPLGEGRVKISIPSFDKGSKVFCKDLTSGTLKDNNVSLKRAVNGTVTSSSNENSQSDLSGILTTNITNPIQVNNLTKRSEIKNQSVETRGCTQVPWATPLLPKHLQVMPKVGEMCKVLIFNGDQPQQNRTWVGPMISRKDRLSFNPSKTGGDLLNTGVIPTNSKDISGTIELEKRGDFTGGFPEPLDISIMSRNNADIVLPTRKDGRDNLSNGGEVLIRAGKFSLNQNSNNLSLNTKNPGYLRIKVVNKVDTHTLLFSDFISLVAYKNSDGTSESSITPNIDPIQENDKQISDLHNSLTPLIRGDSLIKFLSLLVDYVKNHNHPYDKLPPTNANSKPEISEFDLKTLLSPNIRIN